MPRRTALLGRRDQYLQYIRGTVVESAINTYTESTINMPVVVGQGYVALMHTMEWEVSTEIAIADISATDDIFKLRAQLTKSTQSSLLRLDDPNVIEKFDLQIYSPSARTSEKGSPLLWQPMGAWCKTFDVPVLLPYEQIFLGAQSQGGSIVYRYNFRVGITMVKLGTTQLVELVQAIT